MCVFLKKFENPSKNKFEILILKPLDYLLCIFSYFTYNFAYDFI